jgi:hypothetical protein
LLSWTPTPNPKNTNTTNPNHGHEETLPFSENRIFFVFFNLVLCNIWRNFPKIWQN